ncbi:FtsL-like putative cell division protein [Prevotella sp.]|uniref:FtsL-like putative cell division protein n=1 Tax=Prevotella sp. TaxID=59823 RepID=UPI003FD7EEF1
MKEETGNNEIKPKAETADVGQATDEENVNVGTEVVEPASEARQELKRLVEEQAREDERPLAGEFKLAKILGGEFLTAKIIRQQLWLILLVVGFTIIYISNRYSCDKQRIEIARLNKELEEAKFKAMSSTSDLTEVSRESNVLEMLRQNKDSVLHIPSQPPYIINVPEQ